MKEILPGVYHWTAVHPEIQEEVDSYLVVATDPAVLIDPLLPPEGLGALSKEKLPQHIYLTNRLHYRHSAELQEAFGCEVWCHHAGLHEFTEGEPIRSFNHGETLPGNIEALEVGVLCPEETALYLPVSEGVLAIGDALVRWNSELGFVPDWLLGDDPKGVKRGIREVFLGHLNRDFDHLLFAHGVPFVGGAKEGLRQYLENLEVR